MVKFVNIGGEIWQRSLKEFINKIKKGKVAGPLGVMSEMIRSTGLHGVGIITADWKLNTIVRCYKDKGDASERGNYRGLQLRDYVLKVTTGQSKSRYENRCSFMSCYNLELQMPFSSGESFLQSSLGCYLVDLQKIKCWNAVG